MHAELQACAKAARWYTELDGGCFTGLATVWKCQVDPHIDRLDWEFSVTICAGNYTGGHMYLPDLNLVLW